MRPIPSLALAASCLLPLAGQTPLYNDGPAFGGSKVFSEGLNPLGNPARFDRPPAGWYMGYVDGDQRSQDNASILQATMSADPAAVQAALARLQGSPWALRTRAYGLAGVKDAMNFGYSREELHSSLAYPDLATGTALAANGTFLDGRRTIVDRVNFGGGSTSSGTSFGYNVRFERWERGVVIPFLTQQSASGSPPYGSMDDAVMGYAATSSKTFFMAMDFGFTTELAQGLRLGATIDQLNAKRLWDVELKPQYRAALQMDMGLGTQLTVEGDLNAVERMPFPVKQQSVAASLRYQTSASVAFLVGGERRKLGDVSVTRGGVTLQIHTSALMISIGFQAGQDRPMKGLALMVN